MNASLSDLKDIQLPADISVWPPAPGWTLLLLVLLTAGLGLWLLTHPKYTRYKQRRTALKKLRDIQATLDTDPQVAAQALSVLVRQCALIAYPRQDVASLTGTAWLTFLDETGKTSEFTQGLGAVMAETPYRADVHLVNPTLVTLIKQWIKRNV